MEDDEITNIFERFANPKKEDFIDKIEGEYLALKDGNIAAANEKGDLSKKLRRLKGELSRTRNVKNLRLRGINYKIAESRKKMKKEMQDIEARLNAIKIEEEGSKISSDTLASTSKTNTEMVPSIDKFGNLGWEIK